LIAHESRSVYAPLGNQTMNSKQAARGECILVISKSIQIDSNNSLCPIWDTCDRLWVQA